MPTVDEIKDGMGLDQILAREMPESVYGALRSPVLETVAAKLDPTVKNNILTLIDQLLLAGPNQDALADGISAELSIEAAKINQVISDDLVAQQEIRKKQDMLDLTTQILPSEVQTPDLLELVTTDQFKEIIQIPDDINVD